MRSKTVYKQRFNEQIQEDSFERLFFKYRKANRLTMEQLAEKLGVTQSAVSFYENPNVPKKITVNQILFFNNILHFDIFQGMYHLMYHTNKVDINGIFLIPEITYEGKEINKNTFAHSLIEKGFNCTPPTYKKTAFGTIIEKKRKQLSMTQDELCEYLRVTPMTISRIETGKNQSISPKRLSQLINIFSLDPFEALYSLSEHPISSVELTSIISSTRTIEIDKRKVPLGDFRKAAKEALIILK